MVKGALSVFDDPNLLKKSVEYAINPPLIVMTNNNMKPVHKDTSGDNKTVNQPQLAFKEIPNLKMNKLQKDTMKILVDEDVGIEKMRGAKMSITTEDEQSNSKLGFHNGPINISQFSNLFSSFMEMEMGMESMTQGGGGKYTKPIAVLMKLPSDPDPKLKKEINTMESKRENFEGKLFKKAKEEFKLITAITKKELQINLNHELLPFFVVSKNGLQGVNDVITNTFPSQSESKKAGFLQLDKSELTQKFPHINLNDEVALNKQVYSKILNFFAGSNTNPPNLNTDTNTNTINSRMKVKKSSYLNNNLRKRNNNYENTHNSSETTPDLLNQSIDFNYQKCFELTKHLKHLDCNTQINNYRELNSHLYSSFLEMRGGGGDDLVNVKFAASDEPYPTIEKLVAQMMTRRDLAEKFERLKILEYESHLQKAENEMIQDILHENLFKIMATYGPSIEGMKEHIH